MTNDKKELTIKYLSFLIDNGKRTFGDNSESIAKHLYSMGVRVYVGKKVKQIIKSKK